MISFFTPQRITILGELKGIVSPSINVLSGLHFILNLQSPFFHISFFHSSACDESRPAVPLRSSPQKQQQQQQQQRLNRGRLVSELEKFGDPFANAASECRCVNTKTETVTVHVHNTARNQDEGFLSLFKEGYNGQTAADQGESLISYLIPD